MEGLFVPALLMDDGDGGAGVVDLSEQTAGRSHSFSGVTFSVLRPSVPPSAAARTARHCVLIIQMSADISAVFVSRVASCFCAGV